jgi:HK97 gp10 family phage protein
MADLGARINVTTKIEGLQEIERALKRVREEFDAKAKTGGIVIRGLMAGAKLIRDDAKARAPLSDPSGMVKARLEALQNKQLRKAVGKMSYRQLLRFQKAEQRRLARAQRVSKKQLALIKQNIVSYPVKADEPTVVVRVSNKGYDRGYNSFRARLNGKSSIRFRNPGYSPGYWWWVEFGTSRFRARPFMRPAFEAQKMAALAAFGDTVRAEIKKRYPGAL